MILLRDIDAVEAAAREGARLYMTVHRRPGEPFCYELTSSGGGEGANAWVVYDLLLEATPSGLLKAILLLADEKRWLATNEELGAFVRALLPLMAVLDRVR